MRDAAPFILVDWDQMRVIGSFGPLSTESTWVLKPHARSKSNKDLSNHRFCFRIHYQF